MQESSTIDTTHPSVLEFRQDLEQQLRQQVRDAIETGLEAELTAALRSGRHERTARRSGYRHGAVERTLTTSDGVRQLRVPRGRVRHADGTTREFHSQLIPRYAWYCQVDENLCDRPTRYCGRCSSWAEMLGIRTGLMPQLDSAVRGQDAPRSG